MNYLFWSIIGMMTGYTLGILNFGIGIIYENPVTITIGSIIIGIGVLNTAFFILEIVERLQIKVIRS